MLNIALYALHLAFNSKLISLIQAKYPQDSPFEKQPILMIISVVATTFYGSGAAFQLMVALLPKYTRLYDRLYLVYVIPISGLLSSASFLLVLVSDKGGWLVLLALLISIAIATATATATYYSFKYIHQLIYKRFCDAILQAIDMLNQSFTQFMRFTSNEQQHSTGTTTSV